MSFARPVLYCEQIKFDIVIHEPGIAEGEPFVEMRQAMLDSVTSLVPIF